MERDKVSAEEKRRRMRENFNKESAILAKEAKFKPSYKKSFPPDILYYVEEERDKLFRIIGEKDTASINDYLFLLGYSQELQKDLYAARGAKDAVDSKLIKDIENQIKMVSSELLNWRKQLGLDERIKEEDNPAVLLERYCKEAEEYIKNHSGEYTWKCSKCGQMHLMTYPHFAFEEGAVWNLELWQLRDKISIEEIAKVLMTSPEALKRTAKKKGLL